MTDTTFKKFTKKSSKDNQATEPQPNIPGPRSLPLVGTAYSINTDNLMQSAVDLAKKHGRFYLHEIPGRSPLYIVSSYALVDELSNEDRFKKVVHPAISAVKGFAGNGLFTSEQDDPEWAKAHRILMPAFNPTALKGMYRGMVDVADQLMLKWSRTRPDVDVDVPSDFTRLTLDTIALCSFSYRFNSFYSEKFHPFVDAMVDGLAESGKRAHALEIQKKINVLGERRFQKDIDVMKETVDALIAERRQNPSPKGEEDVMDVMLNATDPVTGQKLSDENLRYQLVTFLIAGHETTSGLLSFAVYELISNPRVYKKAQGIVDEVLDGRFPQFEDLRDLGYLDQILREALRKYPTAPAYAVTPYETTTIGESGGTAGEPVTVNPGDTLLVLLPHLHTDPEVWDNPDEFRPERFDFENAKKIPHNAWKPFGNGQRSCLGRAFALQEATMVLALLLQHFDFEFSDPNYKLKMLDGLTSKPEDLYIHVHQRSKYPYHGPHGGDGLNSSGGAASGMDNPFEDLSEEVESNGHCIRLLVGSNAGTSRNFANRLASFAGAQGYETRVEDLDSAVDNLDPEETLLICTSSYEGLPPDNAKKFVAWLEQQQEEGNNTALNGVNYAVFGCGNSEWASTFHRIPKLIDDGLEKLGAHRITERGEADVRGDYVGVFQDWTEKLWPKVGELTEVKIDTSLGSEDISAEIVDGGRGEVLRSEGADGYVVGHVENIEKLSTDADGPVPDKYRVDIRLPEGTEYTTGDYLEFLPHNSDSLVDRVLDRLHLTGDQRVVLDGRSSFLPINEPISLRELLGSYVELSTPAGQRQVRELAENCPCPPEQKELQELASDEHYDRIQKERHSVLDLLERFPSVQIDLSQYLSMLMPLAPRRYSISSSALKDPQLASITFSRVSSPAWSGQGVFEGVATNHLTRLKVGAPVTVTVVEGSDEFRGEKDVSHPMLLVGAGTGIAPLRAFIEDAAIKAESNDSEPGQSLLFFGCHGPDSDFLYRDDLEKWEKQGVVEVRTAFSRHPENGEEDDIRYVQHRLWNDREDVIQYLNDGARVLVCGDASTLAPAVRETMTDIVAQQKGVSAEEAKSLVEKMEREEFTYVSDVFT